MIQNSGVRVYSFPDINKFILMKLKVSDQVVEVTEEEKRVDIITKKNDLIYIEDPYFELYFQVFDENDAAANEHFKRFKNL